MDNNQPNKPTEQNRFYDDQGNFISSNSNLRMVKYRKAIRDGFFKECVEPANVLCHLCIFSRVDLDCPYRHL